MGLKRIVEKIKKNRSFLVTSHVNLEGDALGSELALKGLLLHLGKQVVVVNEDNPPPEYSFLPGINNIKKLGYIKNRAFDAFIVVDCSDLGRCGKIGHSLGTSTLTINIDHHISNNRFGDVNWVDPYASSASEMIYEIYKKMGVPLDRDKSLCLYTGILTDTGSFHYSNTTPKSLNIAADLIGHNLDVNKIYKNIYENIPFSDIGLLVKIINTISQDRQGKIIWFRIEKDILRARKVSIDLTEYVLNFGRLIKEAEVVILFKENLQVPNQIRLNFRSRRIDVNKIAKMFGGGGHKSASGATVKGSLESVQRRVIDKVKQQLSQF